jgi:hypothetical protein
MAKHIQNALKLVNVDDKTLKAAGLIHIPIYSQEENEGLFVNLDSMLSPQSNLPTQLVAQLNSVLNDEFRTSDLVRDYSIPEFNLSNKF